MVSAWLLPCCPDPPLTLRLGDMQDRSQPPTGKLVGMGGCGVDYVAQVASYPRANDKLRTEKLEVGGWQC